MCELKGCDIPKKGTKRFCGVYSEKGSCSYKHGLAQNRARSKANNKSVNSRRNGDVGIQEAKDAKLKALGYEDRSTYQSWLGE